MLLRKNILLLNVVGVVWISAVLSSSYEWEGFTRLDMQEKNEKTVLDKGERV